VAAHTLTIGVPPVYLLTLTTVSVQAGAPIEAEAFVKGVTDGVYPASHGSVGEGATRNLGQMARLQIGGVDVLVNASRQQSFDEGAFTLAGIDFSKCHVLGIKSSTHFRGGWTPCAGKIITADCPGSSSNLLENFDLLRKVPVTRWPTSASATYTVAQTKL
jgi:microcystin degradation protein MlrC